MHISCPSVGRTDRIRGGSGGGSHGDLTAEAVRRATLYGVSSRRHLPIVQSRVSDARARQELARLMAPPEESTPEYEEAMQRSKHQEHAGFRPAMDRSHAMQDLFTTVPKQIQPHQHQQETSTVRHDRAWRLGAQNRMDSDGRGPDLRGLFQPSDSICQRLLASQRHRASTTATAYPVPVLTEQDVRERMQPMVERDHRERPENGEDSSCNTSTTKKVSWCPAGTIPMASAASAVASVSLIKGAQQRHPVRTVTSPLRKPALLTDERCLQRQQVVNAQAEAELTRQQTRFQKQSDPTTRYTLPIDNPDSVRAHRLGLQATPSSLSPPSSSSSPAVAHSTTPMSWANSSESATKRSASRQRRPKLLLRPRSAVTLRMDTTLASASMLSASSPPSIAPARQTRAMTRSTSVTSCGSADPTSRRGIVAGAMRRPHSASVSFLAHSTVYCAATQSSSSLSLPLDGDGDGDGANRLLGGLLSHKGEPQEEEEEETGGGAEEGAVLSALSCTSEQRLKEQNAYGIEYFGQLMKERARREGIQARTLRELATRGLLHNVPIPQIFARLRREALKNLATRAQQARYDKMPLNEYMSLCGMAPINPSSSSPSSRSPVSPTARQRTKKKQEEAEAEEDHPRRYTLEDQFELRVAAHGDPPGPTTLQSQTQTRPDPTTTNNSSTTRAMRRALTVTREQVHLALEPFSVSTRDVNALFSALDVQVAHALAVWMIVAAVERVQEVHEAQRRARVTINAREPVPPRALELPNQPFAVPLPVPFS